MALTVALAVSAFESSFARAADPAEDELNRQGVDARKRDDDAAALALFRKAYELHHSPRSAAQMGLAEIALGQWTDAEAHLREALGGTTDPWIQKNERVLRDSLARVQEEFGTIQVLGGPNGAEVMVEGKVLGTLPMHKPGRVRTGECRFEVRAPGYVSATRTVTIKHSVPRRETVELAPFAPTVSAQNVAAQPSKDEGGFSQGRSPSANPPTGEMGRRRLRPYAWVAARRPASFSAALKP
ncbi:MAG: PEGA domain-containing protein [Deltaproteobacteria bacterium]|nr:PEGA domain-containing protein [Deltaproteobacteria bacterium]